MVVNVKSSLGLIEHGTMKMFRSTHSNPEGRTWSTSNPGPLTPGESCPDTQWIRRRVGSRPSVKGKAGLDKPLELQKVEAPRTSRQSAHEGGKIVSPTQRPPLPPGDTPVTSVKVYPRAIVRPEGLSH